MNLEDLQVGKFLDGRVVYDVGIRTPKGLWWFRTQKPDPDEINVITSGDTGRDDNEPTHWQPLEGPES